MKRVATIASMIAIISLPSCKQPKSKKAALSKAAFSFAPLETNIDLDFQEQTLRAQLDDIPTFVGSSFIFIDDMVSEGNLSFIVSCKASMAAIKDFYCEEMENLGWQKIGQLDATGATLIFQKPRKISLIAIQPSLNEQEVAVQIKSTARIAE